MKRVREGVKFSSCLECRSLIISCDDGSGRCCRTFSLAERTTWRPGRRINVSQHRPLLGSLVSRSTVNMDEERWSRLGVFHCSWLQWCTESSSYPLALSNNGTFNGEIFTDLSCRRPGRSRAVRSSESSAYESRSVRMSV